MKILWTCIICLLLGSTVAWAAKPLRIIILPFKINASAKQAYLSDKIPEVMRQSLSRNNATVFGPKQMAELKKFRSRKIKSIRKLGENNKADYIIWGSLTWIGKGFSIDAKMLETVAQEPVSFYDRGADIGYLSGKVNKLVRAFETRIFRHTRVGKIIIAGNKRIEALAIKKNISTKPGDVFLDKILSEDLKAVWEMGYFDDIRIQTKDSPEGKLITIMVKEKPTIRKIKISSNRVYDDQEIKEEALEIKTGSILNIFTIQNNIKRIKSLYDDKNYHNAKVEYKIHALKNNQADLEFIITEGQKIRIKTITIIGNKAYTAKKLRKKMKSKQKGFFSWLTSSGDLNEEDLNQDAARLTAFYHNNGYMQARIAEPQIKYQGDWIYITIKISEGTRYKIGKIGIEGDTLKARPRVELLKNLKLSKEEYFNQEVMRNDILMLTDAYSDEGYANAEVLPGIKTEGVNLVNITYKVSKDELVYFDKILINGNTKTRDKVIRRALKVYEQELFSGSRLKRSIRNLHRLDYFEDIKVNMVPGEDKSRKTLKLDVIEKPTGTFSFGGGYSSVENVFAMASISQRNLFGRGQSLQLKAEAGGTTNRYTLSFTEPYLFDIPLSAGFDLYNWNRDYTSYDKDSKGGGVRFGYPVYDYTRAYLSYAFDIGEIENVDADASESIKALEGSNITSSVSVTLQYDSRDRAFNPTEGGDHSLTIEYAGVGGDIAFTKYTLESGFYYPLFWGTVGFLHGRSGYVKENDGGSLPDYERFYLGGMNSLRGFEWQDIHSLDPDGAEIGGNKFIQFNVEYLVPLIKKAGLVGLVFFDTGSVYNNDEDVDFNQMRESAGFGFRWYSPMGPIRIENGYILDPKEGERTSGRWEFTMGGAF